MSGPTSGSTVSRTSSDRRKSSSSGSRKCGVSSSSESLAPFSARCRLKIASNRSRRSGANSWRPGSRYPFARKNSTSVSVSTAFPPSLAWRLLDGSHDLHEQVEVLGEVLRRRLRGDAGRDGLVEMLQLVGVRILEVRPQDAAPQRVAVRLLGDQQRRKVPHVRGVVLDPG